MEELLKPIYCYVSPSGNNKIADWYKALSWQEKADADEFIKIMRKNRDWSMPHYLPRLRGHNGIGELRWVSGKKQHRLVGYLHSGAFFVLIGCSHKQQIYDPPEALDTADKRKRQIEDGEARTVDYDL